MYNGTKTLFNLVVLNMLSEKLKQGIVKNESKTD